MKTEYYVEYHCGLADDWVRQEPRSSFKLIGFARRDAKKIKSFWPGTKTRIVKKTLAIVK
jgi:hypothetical protein